MRILIRTIQLFALACSLAVWSLPCRADNGGVADTLDQLARTAMATGLTQGMSVAVVQGDHILWSAGFGYANRETGLRSDPDTRYYIASTSKALTALAAVRLAVDGALDLDAPLSRALKGAVFPEGVSGDSITVRDLLTHTHGIDPEGPVSVRVAYTGDYQNTDILRALGAHKAAESGRAFRYSNLGYDLLGIVLAPEVTGGWKDVVEQEVTAPLHMRATTAFRSRVPPESLAVPYELGPDGFERVPVAKEDANMGPAGGHFSTADDLARLVIAELNRGKVDGAQVIDPTVIAMTQKQQATQDRNFGFYHRHGWGFGWDLGTYEGDTLVHRFGTYAGYRSHVSFMPRHGLGVVVLTNGGAVASRLTDVLATGIYDHLLNRAGADSIFASRLTDLKHQSQQFLKAMAAEREKRAARPQIYSHPLDDYVGVYGNPDWGTVQLQLRSGQLEANMGVARSAVEVYDAAKDELRVELLGGGGVILMQFKGATGKAQAIEFMGATFRRQSDGNE